MCLAKCLVTACNLHRLMPVKAPGRQLWRPSWQACSSSWTPAKMLFITFKETWLPWRPITSRYATFVLCTSSPSLYCRCLFCFLVSVVWCNIDIYMHVKFNALQPCQCFHFATLILLPVHASNDMQHKGETVLLMMA